MGKIILALLLVMVSLLCLWLSYRQFHEKGFLFNNAYLYASDGEREQMDKTPHYRQSGIVFALLSLIFAINAVDVLLETEWLFYLILFIAAVTVVYAIVSSVQIERKKKEMK